MKVLTVQEVATVSGGDVSPTTIHAIDAGLAAAGGMAAAATLGVPVVVAAVALAAAYLVGAAIGTIIVEISSTVKKT